MDKDWLVKVAYSFDKAEEFTTRKMLEQYFFDVAKRKDICIFGGGALGKQICEWLQKSGIKPAFYSDNNIDMRDKLLNESVPYIPFQELKMHKDSVYVIVAVGNRMANDAINRQLSEFPCVWHNPLGITVYWAQIFNISKAEFIKIAEQICIREYFEEEYSVQLYQKLLKLRLQHEVIDYNADILDVYYSGTQYIVKDLIDYSSIHTYVDCGAFTGDTLDAFITLGTQAEYYLFEMDEVLCQQLREHVGKLNYNLQKRIHIYPYGVGKQKEKVFYVSDLTGGSRVAETREHEAEIVPLDDIYFDKKIDFIKMDIEGMEEEALLGAKRLIQDNHPVLAISVYHHLAQFLRIPKLIHEICSGYKLFLRHHKYTMDDTVCYAVYSEAEGA